ncbi:SMC domain protein [Candidatus Sulfopaludibacter sp. SbA6]|nr:SMC domain protein [Candidatus Sulfopaludibacter sp. SbA6]
MRLTSVRAKNFKSFKDLDIRLDNLNVLIGANASGKSNFVQLFKFIRDIAEKGLGNAVSLQGGARYLRNANCGEGDQVSFELSIEHDLVASLVRSEYRLSLAFSGGRQVSIAEEELRSESRGGANFAIRRTENQYQIEGDPSPVQGFLPAMQSEDVSHSRLLIGNLPWFFPLRSIAAYDIDPKAPKIGALEGLSELEPDANNLAIVLDTILSDDEGRRKLMNLVRDVLPFVDALEIETLSDRSLFFKMRERYSQQAIPAAFLSDGTIDVIALIVILYFERKPLVLIEEAARNLHPSLMSGVVAFLEDASRLKQIVVTTHNPELVRHANTGQLILVSRDVNGYSHAKRPAERASVQQFLRDEIGIHELYVEDLLEV